MEWDRANLSVKLLGCVHESVEIYDCPFFSGHWYEGHTEPDGTCLHPAAPDSEDDQDEGGGCARIAPEWCPLRWGKTTIELARV